VVLDLVGAVHVAEARGDQVAVVLVDRLPLVLVDAAAVVVAGELFGGVVADGVGADVAAPGEAERLAWDEEGDEGAGGRPVLGAGEALDVDLVGDLAERGLRAAHADGGAGEAVGGLAGEAGGRGRGADPVEDGEGDDAAGGGGDGGCVALVGAAALVLGGGVG